MSYVFDLFNFERELELSLTDCSDLVLQQYTSTLSILPPSKEKARAMSDPARSDRASKRSSGQAKTTTTAASTKNAGTKRADQRTESAEADNTDADSIHSRHALQVFKSNKSANGSQSDISMVLDQHRQSNGGGGDVEESLDDEARAARDSAKAAEEASFRTFRNRTLLKAGLNFGALFVVCALLCFLTLWFVLPPIDEYVCFFLILRAWTRFLVRCADLPLFRSLAERTDQDSRFRAHLSSSRRSMQCCKATRTSTLQESCSAGSSYTCSSKPFRYQVPCT